MKILLFTIVMLIGLLYADVKAQLPTTCTPEGTTSSSSYISNVKLGSINNSSGRGTLGYSDYTYLSTSVAIGHSYTITLTSSRRSDFVARWTVYIDYNKNGIMDDAGETIGTDTMAAGKAISFSFVPPATAFNGAARLRVQMTQFKRGTRQKANGNNPCVMFDEGETEDYTVNLSGGFCYAHGQNSASDYISNVTMSNLSKTSGNDNGYGDYTSQSAGLTCGFTYPVSLSRLPSSSRTEYWSIYIDYNNNKSFADAGELVATAAGTNTSVTSLTIPFLTSTGAKRMRVQMSHDGYVFDPCAEIANGEVEDYTATILPPVLSTGKVLPGGLAAIGVQKASVSVSPNPAHASGAVVTYTVLNTGNVYIRVTDMSGRNVVSANAGSKTAGTYTYPLSSLGTIAAGNYVISAEQNSSPVAHNRFIITN